MDAWRLDFLVNQFYATLPWPVSVNRYWAVSRGGIRYVTKRGKDYKDEVADHLAKVRPKCCPFDVPVRIEIAAHPPDRRKRDIDNTLKVLLDSLGGPRAIYTDDCLVSEIFIHREKVVDGGCVNVHVEPI